MTVCPKISDIFVDHVCIVKMDTPLTRGPVRDTRRGLFTSPVNIVQEYDLHGYTTQLVS